MLFPFLYLIGGHFSNKIRGVGEGEGRGRGLRGEVQRSIIRWPGPGTASVHGRMVNKPGSLEGFIIVVLVDN
jgi:hypothetical protein